MDENKYKQEKQLVVLEGKRRQEIKSRKKANENRK